MRCSAAWLSLAVALSSLVYAPLFHLHLAGEDEHGVHGALIHSHLPEHSDEDSTESGIQERHQRGVDRQVDLLVGQQQHGLSLQVVESKRTGIEPVRRIQFGFVSIENPRTHDPPVTWSLSLRSPPALASSRF